MINPKYESLAKIVVEYSLEVKKGHSGIYYGQEIEDIYLEFKEGEVVTATTKKGSEILEEILKMENWN